MQFSLAAADFGRLACTISDARGEATVTSSNPSSAAADLAAAIDSAVNTGSGECYWREAGGEYRWMFRRNGEMVAIVVLWSAGTLTGWEHVFQSECDVDPFARQVRDELDRLGIAAL